jgi:hypothetical protein
VGDRSVYLTPVEAARVAGSTILTASYVEVIAATAKTCAYLDLSNQGTAASVKFAVGAAGSEVDIPHYIVLNERSERIYYPIPVGSRISVKALDTNGTGGSVIVNLMA